MSRGFQKGLGIDVYKEAYDRLGSVRAVARELGVHESTVRRSIRTFQSRQDPGLSAAAEAVGTQMTPALAWLKTKPDEGGRSYSVLLKPVTEDRDFMADLREAFEGFEPSAPIEPPEQVMADLCTVYPLMDVHFGMMADREETGGVDYDIKRAVQDMRLAFAKIGALTPASAEAILIVGGDFFHANDQTNQTPGNKHGLDTDTRHWKVLQAGVEFLAEVVETIARKHSTVTVRVLRGNHDPESHMVLTFAMNERYRLSPHIRISTDPRDLFTAQWGKCLIAAHHGDKAPPERLTLYLSDVCPYWSETRHRYCFTGHVHKDQARDVGPLRWESLRAFAPPDAYAAGMGYAGRRAMQALTFHSRDGLVLRALDPIER
jgi:hypothetical protein